MGTGKQMMMVTEEMGFGMEMCVGNSNGQKKG